MRFAQRIAEDRPLLISGDFNAEPNEPVYSTVINYTPLGLSSAYADLMATLFTDENDEKTNHANNSDGQNDTDENGTTNGVKNRVDYLMSNEPPFTTWKIREEGEVCHTIDYVFYSQDKLKVFFSGD